jgi:uncharacterized membrane protein YeaQ/YmgE (transglycosylase-associated protein family)
VDFSIGSIIIYALAGLVIGLIARFLLPGRDPIGLVGTILVGAVSAIIGGYLWEAIFGDDNEGIAWIGSIIVAMVVLFILRRVMGTRRSTA